MFSSIRKYTVMCDNTPPRILLVDARGDISPILSVDIEVDNGGSVRDRAVGYCQGRNTLIHESGSQSAASASWPEDLIVKVTWIV